MKVIKIPLEGLLVIEPTIFKDERGYFFESHNKGIWTNTIGIVNFVQDNESLSSYGVLRGLHFQKPPFEQAKLVRCIQGNVWDVAVDLRKDSHTFGLHFGIELSGENKTQLFVPRGFAHGYVVLSKQAIFAYKVDNPYNKSSEAGILYNDPFLNIDWKVQMEDMLINKKDLDNLMFEQLFG